MAIANPFSITYGSRTVGGTSSTYQLHGPYVFDVSYATFRLVFDVVVVASSFAGLQSASEELETDFRKRLFNGERVQIDLDGNAFDYTVGETVLRVRSSIQKSGNETTDRGYSRAYTVSIEGEMPADDSRDDGLRDVEVHTDFDASRRKTVTMRGTYTATESGTAFENYSNNADDVAQNYLDVIDSEATWELATESHTLDRENDGSTPTAHLCNWTRQYVQLVADQSQGQTDDTQIKDHRVTFTDLHQYPGDSREDAHRLHRVSASYDCAVDIDETTDLQSVYDSKIKAHLRQMFRDNYQPSTFGIEDERIAFDHTGNRVSITAQFIFQPSGGEDIVEVAQSVAYREARQIDYTPVHGTDELAMIADVGFAVVERIWSRTVVVIGEDTPKKRIVDKAAAGPAGKFVDEIGGDQGPDTNDTTKVNADGWNVISSTCQVTPRWIGDPNGDERLRVTVLTETVVERFHRKPSSRTGGGGGPTTPGGSFLRRR